MIPALVSLEAFKEHYRTRRTFRRSVWRSLWRRDWYGVGFDLRIRVPDGLGFFGRGVAGASWCWPWQWFPLYYERRRAANP